MNAADWPGRIIDGRYAVEAVLGEGGMGLVLRARHQFTGAMVALKVLRPELQLDASLQHRFLAEARAPSAIGHPGIVHVVDAGRAPDGLLYLVMELLLGRPLRTPLARGELAAPEVRRIILELLGILGAAHARGFVHRDLKPENVFLVAPNDAVKLLDFGIAKVLDAGALTGATATGATLGTPAYMAPEQIHDPSLVDARADLWAVGVMLYEMLTGRLPFGARTTAALLVAIATSEHAPIRSVLPAAPPELEVLFQRALCRGPQGRFGSAAEMAAALAAIPLVVAAQPTRPAILPTPITGVDVHGATMLTGAPGAGSPTAAAAPVAGVSSAAPVGSPAQAGRRRRMIAVAAAVTIAAGITALVAARASSTQDPWDTPGSSRPAPTQRTICEVACEAASSCLIATTTCVADCERDPVYRGCLEPATRQDCSATAQCWFRSMCDGLKGRGTCLEAGTCQTTCITGDIACGCRCTVGMAPQHALALMKVDVCAINCGFDAQCIRQRCTVVGQACALQ